MGENLGLIKAIRTLYGMRNVKREGWLIRGVPRDQCESVWNHSLNTARASWAYTQDPSLFLMMIIHDGAEPIVGDITPYDNVNPAEKSRLETEAMKRITFSLPYGSRLMELWLEYEAGTTQRAKTGKQLDKLDAVVQALIYESKGFEVSEFYDYTREGLINPRLLMVFDRLLKKRTHIK